MDRPLTAAQLADALGYFSNTAISAMHRNTATEACIAQGLDAVACRLAEIATENEAQPAAFDPIGSGVKAGVYVASKTRHAPIWKAYRERGWPINSTWIDEAGAGESGDLNDLWRRCVAEASSARVLVVYREDEDVLKGGWVEVGAALASGVPVYAVGLDGFTIAHDKRIQHFATLGHAMEAARATALSTHTAAGAGPVSEAVGEAVAFRKGDDTLKVDDVHAVYGIDMLTNEPFTHPWWGNRIEVYGEKGGEALRDRILAFLTARPAEEPGEVERLTRERDMCRSAHRELMELYEVAIAKRKTAETALAETREALRRIAGSETKDALAIARAALTGDAQEAGR